MRFGIIAGNVNAPDEIREFALAAEKYGFDHFLLSDHYWLPEYPDLLETWSVIASLAAVTSRIKIGTCVSPITFRPPLQLAKIVNTLDIVSSGRVIVGVGAGWYREEFEMFSEWRSNRERFEQFKEALQLLLMAWTEGKVCFEGKYYRIESSVVAPLPIQRPHPPIWFGGWGAKMLKLAGNTGDGWVSTGPRSGEGVKTPSDYAKYVREIKRGINEAGRRATSFSFGCRFGPLKQVQEHVAEIEAFSTAGLNCYDIGINVKQDSTLFLRSFADVVIASF